MPSQMISRQINQFLGRMRGIFGEELGVDMAAELLDPYFIEPCFRRFCASLTTGLAVHLKEMRSLLDGGPESSAASSFIASASVVYPRRRMEDMDNS